ncbi:MAG: DMT family transporter [candidate division Zixibacteria bacterium]|nr:DMT family transporter [candidate division Zixibacteria bacterium]
MLLQKKWLLLLPATLAVSWAAIFIRFSDAPSNAIAFYRMLFAVVLLSPFAVTIYRNQFREFTSKVFWISALAGFILGWHFFFWIKSLDYTSISSSVILVSTQPIFMTLMASMFLKEKAGMRGTVAIILAIIGTAFIAGFDFLSEKDYLWGDILALIGTLMAAVYLFLGRVVRSKVSFFPYLFTVYGLATLTLGTILLVSGELIQSYRPINYFYFFLLALVPTIIGHSLYNYAMRHVKAYKVGLSLVGEPILASIWAIFIFAEYPSIGTIIGGILIISALILVFSEKGQ